MKKNYLTRTNSKILINRGVGAVGIRSMWGKWVREGCEKNQKGNKQGEIYWNP